MGYLARRIALVTQANWLKIYSLITLYLLRPKFIAKSNLVY